MTIHRERDERTDIGEGGEPCVLVRFEDRGHGPSFCAHLCQKVCGHPLAIYHEIGQVHRCGGVFITSEHMSNPPDQMQITAMRGSKQWMPLVVMQEYQCTTAQDFARASNESSGNHGVAVDGFAMSVQVHRR